jgi:gas vesicle structural protein
MNDLAMSETESLSLCEALDRVLNKGAVVAGEITISVANVDLIYLGLQLVLGSIESIRGQDRTLFGRTGDWSQL